MEAAATRAFLYCAVSTPHASHLAEGKCIGMNSLSGEGDPRASGNINSLPPPRSAPAILPPPDLHLDTVIPPPPNPDLVLAQQLLDRIHADAQYYLGGGGVGPTVIGPDTHRCSTLAWLPLSPPPLHPQQQGRTPNLGSTWYHHPIFFSTSSVTFEGGTPPWQFRVEIDLATIGKGNTNGALPFLALQMPIGILGEIILHLPFLALQMQRGMHLQLLDLEMIITAGRCVSG